MSALKNRIRAVGVSLLAASALAGTARADTLEVPADHPTIQSAIVVAQQGDTVLVAPGTYLETIDFLGKAITVESSGGAAVTTIDGNGGGSVVSFQSGETQSSVLRGFTITGGTGSVYSISRYIVGGGILVLANPHISECLITGNTAADYGGGVYIEGGALIVDCTISANTSGQAGGGVMIDWFAHVELEGCTLAGNSTTGSGGGFHSAKFAVLKLTDCLIENNSAAYGGGGSYRYDGDGFIVFEMQDCTVMGNSAIVGGGLATDFLAGVIIAPGGRVHRCRFLNNTASRGGAVHGSGSSWTSTGVGFYDCLFASNSASEHGGAVVSYSGVYLQSCTVVENSAPTGAGHYNGSNSASLSHCILWGNAPDQLGGGPSSPTWCDIQGGYPGTGNIDIDPFFVDPPSGDYHLAPTSACVNAGDPIWQSAAPTDIDGDPRVLFGRIDIGMDEATFPKGQWTFLGHALAGAGGPPSLVGTGTLIGGTPMTLALSGAAMSTPTWLVLGTGQLLLPFKGGVMVPTIDMLIGPIGSGPAGGYALNGNWPMGLPTGFVVRLQTWIADASGPSGFTASNGLAAQSQ